MSLEHERLARAKEIFADAIEVPPGARTDHVEAACAGEPELREIVRALVSAHDAAARFMHGPSRGLCGEAAAPTGGTALEEPGSVIGRYKLLERIGEGGFGVVFMAEQSEPVVRRVALKVIKAGMDTHQVVARFEAERQALAMMDHPNIAKVLDAGATETGRPFFVMELVRGDPITEYCDRNNLTTVERLLLFTAVCHAVQHAHQKGIIHRDIKPSNVLVTMFDGRPIPKVIDFGIAKAMNQRLTDKTLFTAHRQLIGTPQYMSPEQAEMSGVDIDTRSDIYSLGVLLYELLTGTTPFDPEHLRSAALAEIQRVIREEEPEKPSTRLSTMKGTLAGVAAHRRTEPARLSAAIRGDLDWIAMKCLEKDRTRRYETANGLALDVARHLAGEPVGAAPPSRTYRISKFARKHKFGALAGAAVTTALVLGVVGTTAGLWFARQAAADARAELESSESIINVLRLILTSADPSDFDRPRYGAGLTVREVLDKAQAEDWAELYPTQRAEFSIRWILGEAYNGLGLAEEAQGQLERALAIGISIFGESDSRLAPVYHNYGDALLATGRPDAAESQFRKAINILEREEDVGGLFTVKLSLANMLRERGQLADATRLVTALVADSRRDDPSPYGLLRALMMQCEIGREAGDWDVVEAASQEALPLIEDRNPLARCRLLTYLSEVAASRSNFEEASRLISYATAIAQRELIEEPCFIATLEGNRAGILWQQGRLAEAEAAFRAVVETQTHCSGPRSDSVAHSVYNLAACIADQGRHAEAEPLIREALAILRSSGKSENPWVVRCLNRLGDATGQLGRVREAEQLYRESLDIARRLHQMDRPDVPTLVHKVIGSLVFQGKLEEAIPFCREALDLEVRIRGRESPGAHNLQSMLGLALLSRGTPQAGAEAEGLLRECLIQRQGAFPDGHDRVWLRFNAMSLLGEAISLQSRFAEAEPLLLDGYAGMKDDVRVPSAAQIGGDRKQEALARIARLYEMWDANEPGRGYDAKAREWRQKLLEPTSAPGGVP